MKNKYDVSTIFKALVENYFIPQLFLFTLMVVANTTNSKPFSLPMASFISPPFPISC